MKLNPFEQWLFEKTNDKGLSAILQCDVIRALGITEAQEIHTLYQTFKKDIKAILSQRNAVMDYLTFKAKKRGIDDIWDHDDFVLSLLCEAVLATAHKLLVADHCGIHID